MTALKNRKHALVSAEMDNSPFGQVHRSVCCCGWVSRWWIDPSNGIADGGEHVRRAHEYIAAVAQRKGKR